MKTFLLSLFTITTLLGGASMLTATTNTIHYTLENGLQVALVKDKSAGVVTVKTVVKAGSIHEDEFLGHGISHYLEHIVSGGSTDMHSEEAYIKTLSLLGGVNNAYTTTDHTAYFINTSTGYLNTAIQTIYEWMFFCTFKASEVDREKEVINREIEKNLAHAQRRHYYLSQQNQYKSHPTKFPVIGYQDEFNTLTRDDLMQYYQEHYTPSNMILIIGGNIDIDNTKALINETFGSRPYKAAKFINPTEEKEPFNAQFVEEPLNINSTYVSLRFSTVDMHSKDMYPLDLIDYILGNGNQSILYKKLVEDEKLAYSLSTSSYTPSYVRGYFEIYFECDYENVEKATELVLETIEKYKKKKFSDKLIKRSKTQKMADDLFAINSIEDKSSKVAMSMLYAGNTNYFNHYVTSFKNIDAKDLQKTMNTYFDTSRLITSISYPNSMKKESQANNSDESSSLTEFIELDNGIRVILEENKELAKLNAQIMSLGGIRAEKVTSNGLGYLISMMIGKQSKLTDKDELESMFEDNGAKIDAALGKNTLYYTLEALSENQEEVLDAYFESYFQADFDKEELENTKRIQKNKIESRTDSWYGEGIYHFNKFFFSNHAYGLSKFGETDSLESIDVNTVKEGFKKQLDPKQLVIYIQGDFDKDLSLSLIKKHSKKATGNNKIDARSRQAHSSERKEKREHSHDVTSLFIGFDGLSYNSFEEQIKLDLVDAVLSGMSYPGGRLHKKLRDAGYVYLVHAQNFVGIEKGCFYIYALTNEEAIDDSQRIIFEEINDIKKSLISQEEFDEAIGRMRFYYQELESEIQSKLLVRSANELYVNNYLLYEKAEAIISTLTIHDVRETANKYLNNAQTLSFHPKQ